MKNAGRAGIVPKDDFDINIKYKRLDAVMYDKSLYIAKKDVPLGTLPTDTTYWMKSIYGNKEPIATTVTVGVVKPDGETITVDEDGTLHGNSKVTVDSELSKESTNPIENRAVAEELEKKLNSDGDSKDLTTTFTSNDSTNATSWEEVSVLGSGEKHQSIFSKISTMFKNIRYLYHMLGTADISTLGEGADIGTVTGALSKLNSDMVHTPKWVKLQISEKVSFSNISDWKIVFDYTAQNDCILVVDGTLLIETNIPYDGVNGMDAFICDMWTHVKVGSSNKIVLPIHWSGYMTRGARFIVSLGLDSQYTYTINPTSTDDTRGFSCNITEFPF